MTARLRTRTVPALPNYRRVDAPVGFEGSRWGDGKVVAGLTTRCLSRMTGGGALMEIKVAAAAPKAV